MQFSDKIKDIAKNMALSINGGDWEKDYTEFQKRGWYKMVQWMQENKEKLDES